MYALNNVDEIGIVFLLQLQRDRYDFTVCVNETPWANKQALNFAHIISTIATGIYTAIDLLTFFFSKTLELGRTFNIEGLCQNCSNYALWVTNCFALVVPSSYYFLHIILLCKLNYIISHIDFAKLRKLPRKDSWISLFQHGYMTWYLGQCDTSKRHWTLMVLLFTTRGNMQ